MNNTISLLVGIVLLVLSPICAKGQSDTTSRKIRIAFGAGNHPAAGQETWINIAENRPQLFVWAGGLSPNTPKSREDLNRVLLKQSANAYYKTFSKLFPIAGTWYWPIPPLHSDSALLMYPIFAEFIQRGPVNTTYYSKQIGSSGFEVELLFLDTWSFSMPEVNTSDLLGEDQWNWLENKLSEKGPKIRLLVMGKSLLWQRKGGQTWSDFPGAYQRIMTSISKNSHTPTVILSGSYPCATVMRVKMGEKYVYEVQSSGINQMRWKMGAPKDNNSIRKPFCQRNYALIDINFTEPATLKTTIFDVQNFPIWEWTVFIEDL
jgi:alkaline phosphatase D